MLDGGAAATGLNTNVEYKNIIPKAASGSCYTGKTWFLTTKPTWTSATANTFKLSGLKVDGSTGLWLWVIK